MVVVKLELLIIHKIQVEWGSYLIPILVFSPFSFIFLLKEYYLSLIVRLQMKYLVAIFLFCLTLSSVGQSQNEKLAYQYFASKQYEKAAVLYKDLHKDQTLKKYYAPLLKSYLFLERFKEAEKLVKRQIKKNPERIEYRIDQGLVYEQWGKESKANKAYENTIDDLMPNVNTILSVGNAFYKNGKYDYAVKAYKRGSKLLDGDYPFSFELAKVYEAQGNLTKMSQSLLEVMDFGDAYLESVKSALSTLFADDVSGKRKKVLQKELLSKVQKNPSNNGLTELLIWFYLQEEKFNAALIHSKAMDKRNEEDGSRIIKLADVCVQNDEYSIAIKAYQYLLGKDDESYYSRRARVELVKTLNLKLEKDPNSNQDDVLELCKNYKEALLELGENSFTIDLMRGYAKILAFRLNQVDDAKTFLNKCIGMKRAKKTDVAKCKIALGDIYVMEDEVWEAALLYGQVNQDFKEDQIGHEAKLRSAKAYFYTGEFEWSKAQLDVLKASTTKLISNDAMLLSILISDNTAMDTSTVPLEMFAQADLYYFQQKDSFVLDIADSIVSKFPENLTLLDDVYFLKAKVYVKQKNWKLALENYQKAVDFEDLLKDDALFEMGVIYEKILNQPNEALKCFERIVLEHEDSIYSIEARKHYRRLRGDRI